MTKTSVFTKEPATRNFFMFGHDIYIHIYVWIYIYIYIDFPFFFLFSCGGHKGGVDLVGLGNECDQSILCKALK